MAKAKPKPALPTEPPTIPPFRAIELLRKQLGEIDSLLPLGRKAPEFEKFHSVTKGILVAAFGKPNGEDHEVTEDYVFPHGRFHGFADGDETSYETNHRSGLLKRKTTLEAAIMRLELLSPPLAQMAAGPYQFHPEIERVSGPLLRDGHFKSAALEAYIRVIDEVKKRSCLAFDGDNLMNQAFGCDNRIPVLKFNSLTTDAERDEQKGLMFLFKGIVGQRNFKAHSNTIFNDPSRAHEHLALASLLMRLLDIASR